MRLAQRYRSLLSPRVRGVHDHDHELGVLIRKVFTRTALHIPMYASKPEFPGGLRSGPRAWVSIAAPLTLLTLVLPVLLGPAALVVPLAAFVAFVAGDLPMHRFVRAERGWAFLVYFVAMHFFLNLVIAVAAACGVLAWLTSRRFRRLYDRPEVATR
jgi:hypothetical protein